MHERDLLPILLLTLAAAPLLARLVGWAIAAHLRAVPGEARRWMPTLPELPADDGTPAARFDRAVRRAERLAIPVLQAQADGALVRGVDAEALAAQIAVPTPVATALLDDWRRRLPCRLRVTRGGKLLHDFPRAALDRAVRGAWHAVPQRLALMAAAIFANLGALWWVVVGVLVGAASLQAVWAAWDEGEVAMVLAALAGVAAVVAVFVLSQLGALLVRIFTWRSTPAMAAPAERQRTMRPGRAAKAAAAAPSSSSDSKSGWLDAVGSVAEVDGEGCLFIVGAAAVAFLLAAVLGGLAVVGIWLRGLWQAVSRLGEPVRDLAPAAWLRQAQPTPLWERWVPTNDLAIRLVRALGRALQLRPADDRLAASVLGRAKAQGGRVAALEIALDHALDLGEAMSVATRLVSRLGGDIEVSEAGDLDFVFADGALAGAGAMPDDAELEYLSDSAGIRLRARAEDGEADADHATTGPTRLAVNLPGLTRDHVLGATRLAGGPLATVAVMAVFIAGDHGDLPIRGLDLSLGALFCLLAPGTLMLAAATRQAVAESGAQGLLRDVRRVTMRRLRRGLARDVDELDAGELAATLWSSTRQAMPAWRVQDVEREVEAALADLDLEPASVDRGGGARWPLQPLRQRLASLQALRRGATAAPPSADADEVVYDSGELA